MNLIINTLGSESAQEDLKKLAYNGGLVCVVGGPKIYSEQLFN